MIHLDTSFLIPSLVQGSPQDRLLRRWIRAGEPLGMSTIVWVEFLCGPVGDNERQLAQTIIAERSDFNEDHAVLAAELFNQSGRRRGTLIDCMIAATALIADAPLATENVADFQRFEAAGLRLLPES